MSYRKDSCKSARCSCTVAVGLQECTCASHMPNVYVGLGLGVQNVYTCMYMYCVCSVYSAVCSRCSNVLGVGVASCVCVCV